MQRLADWPAGWLAGAQLDMPLTPRVKGILLVPGVALKAFQGIQTIAVGVGLLVGRQASQLARFKRLYDATKHACQLAS